MSKAIEFADRIDWLVANTDIPDNIADIATELRRLAAIEAEHTAMKTQEPVAYRFKHSDSEKWQYGESDKNWYAHEPLYANPQAPASDGAMVFVSGGGNLAWTVEGALTSFPTGTVFYSHPQAPAAQVCKTCNGSKEINDAEAGDMYFRTAPCPDCTPAVSEREAFESDLIARGITHLSELVEIRGKNSYCHQLIQTRWESWQARSMLNQPAIPEGMALIDNRLLTESNISNWLEMGAPPAFQNICVSDMKVALKYFLAAAQEQKP